jgi:hypothetical protein
MKRQMITILSLGVFGTSLFVPISFAQTITPTGNVKTQRLQALQETRITDLKTRADNEITRRITSLSSLTTRLGNMKHLTTDQIASFTNEVNTEISNLTTVKTKIDGDTDLTTLKTDVQSIVKSYRVYALFLPQINILSAADRVLNIIDQFSVLVTKLHTRIQEAETAGKDTTALQTSLTDIENKISGAKTQAETIITMITPLTPDGYPGNKTTLQSARNMFKGIYQDFVSAKKDAQSIISGLRAMHLTSPTSSVTPAPTS